MKGGTGTSTGSIYRRPIQRGNRRCKDCLHLKSGLRIVKGEQFNYYCDATHKPTHYTTKCYCSHYKVRREQK